MKQSHPMAFYHFLLASLLSVSAQSFLFASYRQTVLLAGITSTGIILLSVFFFFVSALSFSLVFFAVSSGKQKTIIFFVLMAYFVYIFLYARALLFVEVILFVAIGAGYIFEIGKKNAQSDYFGYAMLIANTVVGIGLLLDAFLLASPLYLPALSARFFVGALFLGTAAIKLFSLLRLEKKDDYKFSKLIVLPWLGWAFIFARIPEPSIFLPLLIISSMVLTSYLLPYEKIRLPENRMFGNFVFPASFLLQGSLFAIFYYFIQGDASSAFHKNDIALSFSLFLSLLLLYTVMKLHYMLHKLVSDSVPSGIDSQKGTALEKFSNQLFAPNQDLLPLSKWQAEKIQKLSVRLLKEKENAKRFTMLGELREELDNQFDDPVAAQLVANSIEKHFRAGIAAVSLYDTESRMLSVLASAGSMNRGIPAGYKQSIDKGIMGRAARLCKIQVVNDTSQNKDYISLQEKKAYSEIALPLVHHGHLKGVILVGSKKKNAFSAADIRALEAVAKELLLSWERSGYNRRLRMLIESNISLSTALNTQSVIEEVAVLAKKTLEARFVFVALFNRDGSFTRISSEGHAPNLYNCLSRDLSTNKLLEVALDATEPFRVRDIRKYKYASSVNLDHNMLRGLIVIPLRLHGVSIGAVLGFGKQGGVFFSKKDESLASLLTTQSATAIESAWLIQELRSTTVTTTLLYQLSFGILETKKIGEAAQQIAKSALRLAKAAVTGIVLFSQDGEVETALEVTSKGVRIGQTIPTEFIKQALATGESITFSSGEMSAHIYLPIQTSLRKYGVLWVEFEEDEGRASSQVQTLQTLANQAAMALERAIFLLDSQEKAEEIKRAYRKLENTYDQTLISLMTALDARDRETEGHSVRVGKSACLIGGKFNLTKEQRNSLQRGSLLHDIGKIGISDAILNKTGKLTEEEWAIMRRHPEIGRKIIQDTPFLQDAIKVVYAHHERWDGSGYPLGLRGKEIPLEARIFAVVDIFDALTSKRSYRETATEAEALAYLKKQAGILLDPEVVAVFVKLQNGEIF